MSTDPNAFDPTSAMWSVGLTKRYADAYRRAKVQTGVGGMIKILSAILGGFIIVISALSGASTSVQAPSMFGPPPGSLGSAVTTMGSVIGIMIGGIGYLLGSLIAANGQILKATLDTAVNTAFREGLVRFALTRQ